MVWDIEPRVISALEPHLYVYSGVNTLKMFKTCSNNAEEIFERSATFCQLQ